MGELSPHRRRRLRTFVPQGAGLLAEEPASALLDLASNDTLALNNHPLLKQAAIDCIARSGVGSGASRLVSGSRPEHQALEEQLSAWLGRERVLLYPSGFQANIAALQLLGDRHSLVLADRRIHHSLLVGVRASGARLQRFMHNDLNDLQQRLTLERRKQPKRRLVVLSESLFSMEGSSPDVSALGELCRHHNAALLLDEAHALGVLGPGGRGLGHGQSGIDLVCGTFGKAFGSGGAFLACNEPLGETLLQSSGAFRYTTALAPPLAAAALAALELINGPEGEQRRRQLLATAQHWRPSISAAGWPRPVGEGPVLAIKLGDDRRANEAAAALEQLGLLVVPIRPPTVPEGESMLRLSLRPQLPDQALEMLLQTLERFAEHQ